MDIETHSNLRSDIFARSNQKWFVNWKKSSQNRHCFARFESEELY
jgi:hypothetical protein